jgi:hypothetical protein
LLRLAFLAQEIVEAIAADDQPPKVTLHHIWHADPAAQSFFTSSAQSFFTPFESE